MSNNLSRRDLVKVGGLAVGLAGLQASSAFSQEDKAKSKGTQRKLVIPRDFEAIATPGVSPILQVVKGNVVARPLFKTHSMGVDDHGFTLKACSSIGWTDLQLPSDWQDILFYVYQVGWNNGNGDINAIGPPGDGTALLIGASGNNETICTDDRTIPQRYFGFRATVASATNDNPQGDNHGGYILAVKKRG